MIKEFGDRLILVGVAHVLPESKTKVRKVISEEDPEIVGVELCPKRYIQLTSESGGGEETRMGFSREALLAKILNYFQEEIGKETGMMPGEEMLTAIREARKRGAEVKLIDQDVNLTLDRLLNRMSFWEKIRILIEVLFSFVWKRDDIDLENFTEEKYVKELISKFKEFSKPAYEVLIAERNDYMADKISGLLKSSAGKVICVVGAGHIPGLTKTLNSRFKNGIPEPWHSVKISWKTQ